MACFLEATENSELCHQEPTYHPPLTSLPPTSPFRSEGDLTFQESFPGIQVQVRCPSALLLQLLDGLSHQPPPEGPVTTSILSWGLCGEEVPALFHRNIPSARHIVDTIL